MKPLRGIALVRPVETEETRGLIILPQTTREREFVKNQHEVIAVGDYEICEDEDCDRNHLRIPDENPPDFGARYHMHDPRITPGAWVLVEQASLIDADPEAKTSYVKIRDIAAVFVETAQTPKELTK